MINIVFVGNKSNKRLVQLRKRPDTTIHVMKKSDLLPKVVIDLFIFDKIDLYLDCVICLECSECEECKEIKTSKNLSHIPVIALVPTDYLTTFNFNCCDLVISDVVSDMEFGNYVNTLIKMKIMGDELKKEKIVLELKVKERTLELQKYADHLNITLNSIGDGVMVTDKNGKIISINPVVEKLFSIVSKDEYINKKIHDIFKFYLDGEELNVFKIVSTINTTYKIPMDSILEFNNIKVRITDSASPILNNNGDFNGMVLVFHDVTDEYKLREKTLESEKRYKRIYDNVQDIIYTHDMNGIFTSVNNNIKTIGYTREEIIGKHISSVLTLTSVEDATEQIELKRKNKNLTTTYNLNVRTKNNDIRIYEVKSNIINGLGSEELEIFGIARDITNIINFQTELKIAKERAESSDIMKTNFILNMNHEMRTPFSSILGFSELLLEQINDPNLVEYISMIISSSKQVSKIIDNIIDISNITSGSFKTNYEEFSINKLLHDIYDFSINELSNRNKRNIKLSLDENDDFIFYGNYTRIKQILEEILINSIKYTNDGNIRYGFVIKNNKLNFYVHDTGMGVPDDKLKLIFESFYQINRQKFKKQEGTGLGLTLCKVLLDVFGGTIDIKSTLGLGTSVYVTLPLFTKKENIKIGDEIKPEQKNVLLIIENYIIYGILELILTYEKLNVKQTSEYFDILERLETDVYDLVIIDIHNLPFDGNEIIKWLNLNKSQIPYVLISKHSEDTEFVISNPINTSQVLKTIKRIFK